EGHEVRRARWSHETHEVARNPHGQPEEHAPVEEGEDCSRCIQHCGLRLAAPIIVVQYFWANSFNFLTVSASQSTDDWIAIILVSGRSSVVEHLPSKQPSLCAVPSVTRAQAQPPQLCVLL